MKVLKFIVFGLACQHLFASSSITPRPVFRPLKNKDKSSVAPAKNTLPFNSGLILKIFLAASVGAGICYVKYCVDRAMSYGIYVHKSVEVINNFYAPSLVFRNGFNFFEDKLSQIRALVRNFQNIFVECTQDDELKENIEYINTSIIKPMKSTASKFEYKSFIKKVIIYLFKKGVEIKDKVMEVKEKAAENQEILELSKAVEDALRIMPEKAAAAAKKSIAQLTKTIQSTISSSDDDKSSKALDIKGGFISDDCQPSEEGDFACVINHDVEVLGL